MFHLNTKVLIVFGRFNREFVITRIVRNQFYKFADAFPEKIT